MTFEEFLTKKKIDLIQLQSAEPALFCEFRNHYSQMGEKSFDHSKKFLFNKLRRAYHLKEEPKAIPVKEVTEANPLASQAEPLLSPTVEATVYTPRFKASVPETTSEPTATVKPAYIPRFKAPPKSGNPNTVASPDELAPPDQIKPAYKPRFKPSIIVPKKEE